LDASPNQIWIIALGDQKPLKITPDNLDADRPLMSPNGRYVAFAGRFINESGFRGNALLFIHDLKSGTRTIYQDAGHFHDYVVIPLHWKSQSMLEVLTDHGETGGHEKITYVEIQ